MTQMKKFKDLNDRFTSLETDITQSNKFEDSWWTLLFFFFLENVKACFIL